VVPNNGGSRERTADTYYRADTRGPRVGPMRDSVLMEALGPRQRPHGDEKRDGRLV
jgi:hypothetical protein